MIVFAAPVEQSPAHLAFDQVPTMTNARASSPAENLLTRDPTHVAVATGKTTTIEWDLTSIRKLNVVSLISSNASHRATWTVQHSQDGNSWITDAQNRPFWAHLEVSPGAGPYPEDADPRENSQERNSSWFYSPAEFSARYVRIVVTDPLATFLSFGRLFVGRVFRPKTSYQYGSSISFGDTGISERTDGGALITGDGSAILSADVKMSFLSTDEVYDHVYEFNYWRRSTREILVCLDVNTVRRLQKNILYCRITEGRQVTADQFEAWSQTWILERF